MTAELATVASFAVCAAVLTITPGADTLLVLTHGVRSGRRAALSCALGVNTGLICWATLTVAGLTALLAALPWAYRSIQVAGAVYLVWLGVTGLIRRRATIATGTAPASVPSAPTRPAQAFRRGMVTNLLNPKVGVFYLSLLPQFAPPNQRGPVFLLTLAAVHLLLSVVWLGAIGWTSGRAARSLSGRTTRFLERMGAFTLIGAGVAIAGASL